MTWRDFLEGTYIVVWLGGVVGIGLFAERNRNIRDFRFALLDEIMRAVKLDFLAGTVDETDDWMWRFKVYEAVSHEQMLWKFWRPLDSFYPDRTFTRPR